MKNFIQDGNMMSVPAPYPVLSGNGVLVGALFGVAAFATSTGRPLEIATRGVYDLPKKAGDTPGYGARLYWDDAAKVITTTPGSNPYVGAAAEAAIGSAATVRVRLNGFVQ
ncbi:capsid cement protein [Methylobacterium sp. CCH5-D2]|uniref:DUF2190 family protein n=1 Tax=Methylobacterium sp. CCH5-D2 TaxID=1768765 RepID=UPI00082C0B80|nr:capsid cement protein [Methylobacterium sp. CCH5-D2]